MNITVPRAALAEAFAIASPVVSKNAPKEIMQYLHLVADDEGCRLLATDGECSISLAVGGVEIKTPGETLLHVSRVGQIVREASGDVMHLQAKDQKLVISQSHGKFSLPTPDPMEFPKPNMEFAQPTYLVAAQNLRILLSRTGFCTDQDSTRFALGGVCLEREHDKLYAVATDGRRLGLMVGNVADAVRGETPRALLPAKALMLIQRLLDRGFKPEDVVSVEVTSDRVILHSPTATISTQQIQGRFPNWQQVVPQNRLSDPTITIPAGPLASAVRQAAIASDSESHGLYLEFTQSVLTLSAEAADVGQSRVTMPIVNVEDATTVKLRLDYRYLLECLRVLEPTTLVAVNIRSHSDSVLLTTGDGYLYLIMPMAV